MKNDYSNVYINTDLEYTDDDIKELCNKLVGVLHIVKFPNIKQILDCVLNRVIYIHVSEDIRIIGLINAVEIRFMIEKDNVSIILQDCDSLKSVTIYRSCMKASLHIIRSNKISKICSSSVLNELYYYPRLLINKTYEGEGIINNQSNLDSYYINKPLGSMKGVKKLTVFYDGSNEIHEDGFNADTLILKYDMNSCDLTKYNFDQVKKMVLRNYVPIKLGDFTSLEKLTCYHISKCKLPYMPNLKTMYILRNSVLYHKDYNKLSALCDNDPLYWVKVLLRIIYGSPHLYVGCMYNADIKIFIRDNNVLTTVNVDTLIQKYESRRQTITKSARNV